MNSKQKVGLVIIAVNLFLVILKGIVWFITDSVAVQSEAFNSLVDTIYSLVIITGFLLSQREKTKKYPEGLVRVEPLVALVISGIIVTTGLAVAYNGLQVILAGTSQTTNSSFALGVLFISASFKFGLYKYVSKKAREYNSPSLAATSIDNRNDTLTGLIAIVGVVSVILGHGWFEGIVAIAIAGYITYSGVKVFEENIEYALGKSVEEEVEETIINSALSHHKVHGVHDVEIHYTGPIVDVSMHLEVEGGMTIETGHDIEIKVADRIRKNCSKKVNEINIHLDPRSLDEWKTEDI